MLIWCAKSAAKQPVNPRPGAALWHTRHTHPPQHMEEDHATGADGVSTIKLTVAGATGYVGSAVCQVRHFGRLTCRKPEPLFPGREEGSNAERTLEPFS